MKTPYPEIRASLDAHLLEVLPGLCSDQDQDPLPPFTLTDADVAWPNAAFTPDADRPYLKPWCLFADTRPVTLGPRGFERLTGVYQISVFDTAGTGLFRAERIAAALTDAFRGGTVLPGITLAGTALADTGCTVRISTATAGTARIDDGRLHIPVSVAWTCYVQK